MRYFLKQVTLNFHSALAKLKTAILAFVVNACKGIKGYQKTYWGLGNAGTGGLTSVVTTAVG